MRTKGPAAIRGGVLVCGRSAVGGQGLEPDVAAVEDVLVTGQPAGGRVLPERVRDPASWQRAGTARVMGDPERVVAAKPGVVACAGGPPVGSRVDHRVGM